MRWKVKWSAHRSAYYICSPRTTRRWNIYRRRGRAGRAASTRDHLRIFPCHLSAFYILYITRRGIYRRQSVVKTFNKPGSRWQTKTRTSQAASETGPSIPSRLWMMLRLAQSDIQSLLPIIRITYPIYWIFPLLLAPRAQNPASSARSLQLYLLNQCLRHVHAFCKQSRKFNRSWTSLVN